MLEVYGLNVNAGENSPVEFNNVSLRKGCTATLSGNSTINLNKCGVYMVSVDASSTTTPTIQLYKNGVAQPQAQSTGGASSFVTLVQVDENNSCCACTSPTSLQIVNTGAAATFTNINCCVTKVV